MIPRRHQSTPGSIIRKRGPKEAHAGMLKKGKGKDKDRRIARGRPPGSGNKIPRSVKEALAQAMELHGDGSGRTPTKFDENGNRVTVKAGKAGKEGHVGYWSWVLQNLPELGVQCAMKFFGTTQVSGPGGGPIQVMSVPPEIISKMSDEQLETFARVIEIVNGDVIAGPGEEMPGDASKYAREIGLLPAPVEQ